MKSGLTRAEHHIMARDLKEARKLLQSKSTPISNAWGVSHKIGKRADNAVKALDRLRSELSDLYESKFDELSPYYG